MNYAELRRWLSKQGCTFDTHKAEAAMSPSVSVTVGRFFPPTGRIRIWAKGSSQKSRKISD